MALLCPERVPERPSDRDRFLSGNNGAGTRPDGTSGRRHPNSQAVTGTAEIYLPETVTNCQRLSEALIFNLLLLLLFSTPASSAITGRWTTADQSILQIYPCADTQLCVRILTVGPKGKPATDENNPDPALRKRAICGLTIGNGFAPSGDTQAKGGHIYDPESGKTYSAQMTAQGDTLKLRGYIGVSLLGRTETWHRTTGQGPPAPSCH